MSGIHTLGGPPQDDGGIRTLAGPGADDGIRVPGASKETFVQSKSLRELLEDTPHKIWLWKRPGRVPSLGEEFYAYGADLLRSLESHPEYHSMLEEESYTLLRIPGSNTPKIDVYVVNEDGFMYLSDFVLTGYSTTLPKKRDGDT